MKAIVALLLLATCLACANAQTPSAQAAAKITNLPGWTQPSTFDMYSSFISFAGKNYFYWHVTSSNSPSTDPLVLWLNGGPGCSSLGGLFTENGPFQVAENLTLVANPFAWNQLANMLYLESPVGTGFSNYPGHELTFYDDNSTAADNYQFLTLWIQQFPQYVGRRFYITGESYAGHYIPTLVDLIVDNPISGLVFGGFMVGNPSTSDATDSGASLDTYLETHGLTSPTNQGFDWNQLNPYDILANTNPACSPLMMDYVRFPHRWNNYTYTPLSKVLKPSKKTRDVPSINPCLMTYTQNYLNQAAVQKAIHVVNSTSWTDCSGPPYGGRLPTVVPYYEKFMNHTNLAILVYSGDEDTVINFIGTETWIFALKRRPLNEWGAWHYSDLASHQLQVAGFGIDFDRISYRTVKGAGHMVPMYQPLPALQLFRSFLTYAATGSIN